MHFVAVTGRFAGEKASHAVGAVTNVAGKAAGWVGDGAHYTYDGVSNTAGAVKDAAYNAAAAAGDQTRSTILSVCLPFFLPCHSPMMMIKKYCGVKVKMVQLQNPAMPFYENSNRFI